MIKPYRLIDANATCVDMGRSCQTMLKDSGVHCVEKTLSPQSVTDRETPSRRIFHAYVPVVSCVEDQKLIYTTNATQKCEVLPCTRQPDIAQYGNDVFWGDEGVFRV
jgi:hypothetical protein